LDGLDLRLVHENAIWRDHVAEECHSGLVEFTFLQFGV
jgi:hypothetical protein